MGKNVRKLFYAVRIGRGAPAIYTSWPEAQSKVEGFKGCQHKGFMSRVEAEEWINQPVPLAVGRANHRSPSPSKGLPPSSASSSSQTAAPLPSSSTSVSSGSTSKKRDVIDLVSSDGPTPEDMPYSSLKRPRASLAPSSSLHDPLSSSSNASARTPATSSKGKRKTIVLDDSSDVEGCEDMLRPPSLIKPPSPLPDCPAMVPGSQDSNKPLYSMFQPKKSAAAALLSKTKPAFAKRDMPDFTGVGRQGTSKGVDMQEQEGLPTDTAIELSHEQQKLLNLAKKGRSLFFTGSAGTGKSVLLREIIRQMCAKHKSSMGETTVHVTGSTGMSAVAIGGKTLHSFAGLGLAKESKEVLLKKLQSPRGGRARERWQKAEVLIIDEISMVDCRFFDKLDFVARHIRGHLLKPFGGLQIIATGDFFQLPPVVVGGGPAPYCFKAMCFHDLFKDIHVLRQVFRQKDERFVKLLNKMREGKVDQESMSMFRMLDRPLKYEDGIDPTHLMSTKVEVGSINDSQLRRLDGEPKTFEAQDKAPMSKRGFSLSPEEARSKLDRNTIAEYKLNLKAGAQVMLIKNLPDFGLVNGSLGKVLGFYSTNELVNLEREGETVSIASDPSKQDPAVRRRQQETSKDLEARRWLDESQAYEEWCAEQCETHLIQERERQQQAQAAFGTDNPMDGAYAAAPTGMSVPGSGATAEQLEMGSAFAPTDGQGPLPSDIGAYPPVQKPIVVDDGPYATRWPVVKFTRATVFMAPMSFEVQNGDGETEAERNAVPLILAWALSIHKSQGQTIERLKVDLSSIFEKGQAYVAVSRATSLEGLEVRGFRPKCVMAAPEVAKFYADHG